MVTFDDLMKGFGVVTVMNACIFTPKKSYTGAKNCKTAGKITEGGMTEDDFEPAYEYIDTLKIANFTQEGPTKTVTGGQYANPLIKYGKTMTAEIQDALGRASTMVRFFGCEYNGTIIHEGQELTEKVIGNGESTYYIFAKRIPEGTTIKTSEIVLDGLQGSQTVTSAAVETTGETKGCVKLVLSAAVTAGDVFEVKYTPDADVVKQGTRLSVTDKFPGAFAIEGDTFFIDQKTGEKKHVFIFIPQFLPDAILTLTQDAEGDATVFDLNGTVSVTDIQDEDGSRSIFYEVREESFFKNLREGMNV